MKFNFKTILSLLWLFFTASFVLWWWIYAFDHLNVSADTQREFRRLYWEGSTFLITVLGGGACLVFYTYKDSLRHEKFKLFFANFNHDIKTSISRLRLQGDLLKEEVSQENKNLDRFLRDLSRLDLQLENSLLMNQLGGKIIFNESIDLAELVQYLKVEFEHELNIQIQGRAHIKADNRAVRSILRNIFENSLRHGQAKNIKVLIELAKNKVLVQIIDDGRGCPSLSNLGQDILQSHSQSTLQSNGLGLYLARQFMKKMNGSIYFESTLNKGFGCYLEFKT